MDIVKILLMFTIDASTVVVAHRHGYNFVTVIIIRLVVKTAVLNINNMCHVFVQIVAI